jgi:hypothetical protein
MNPTGLTGTGATGTGAPVTIAEIAEFLQHLRALSRPDAGDTTPDVKAERAAFLARKADLFARIAAQHPDLIPTPTATTPTATTPTGGGRA